LNAIKIPMIIIIDIKSILKLFIVHFDISLSILIVYLLYLIFIDYYNFDLILYLFRYHVLV